MSEPLRDMAAERGVLAGIYQYGQDCLVDVEDIVTDKSFADPTNQILYSCFQHSLKDIQTLDLASLLSAAKEMGVDHLLDKPAEADLVRAIINFPVRQGNVRRLAGKVQKLAIARQLDDTVEGALSNLRAISGDEPFDHILGLIENPLVDFSSLLTGSNNRVPTLLGQGLRGYIEHLMSNPVEQVGLSTGYPIYDKAIGGGLRRKTVNLIGARPKAGKAQPLEATVYTPDGPKRMGEIKVGDIVSTPDGAGGKVLGIFPQGKKKTYRITFSDGDTVECCVDHLWKVKHRRRKKWEVKSLKDILEYGNILEYDGRPKWRIPLSIGCRFNKREVGLNPYLLGVLIGDGSIKTGAIFTNTDSELISEVESKLLDGYRLHKTGGISYRITHGIKHAKNYYRQQLRRYGLLGCGSHDKFIPNDYKYNSVDVRVGVLNGLLDTDGYIDERGGIEYTTTSLKLAEDIKELVQSLGGLCSFHRRFTSCQGRTFPSYRCRIRFNDPSESFLLSRKRNRVKVRTKPSLTRSIAKIEELGEKEMQCILLDTPDHLYLTDNHVVTHNTTLGINVALFISHVLRVPVLYLDTEMSQEDHWNKSVAKLSQVEVEEIETGKFGRDQNKKQRVLTAVKTIEEALFHLCPIAGQPFEETLSTMRRWVKKDVGFDANGRAKDCVIIFDYLKLMSSDSLVKNLAEFQVLGFMMTGLHNFMHRHDVPCLSFAQLNRDGIDKESTDVVSQSDRIIWLCSNFSIYKKKTPEEIGDERTQGVKDICNRKMIPLVARHGAGLDDDDYINYKFEGQYARISESQTKSQVYASANTNKSGFEVNNDASEVKFDA